MASSPATNRIAPRRAGVSAETRFDRTLAKILSHATDVFYEKGYEGASIRDLSRASGMSLAGLYYYFDTKERLLYLIQKHTFSTIVESLRNKLEGVSDPEQRIRLVIHNHLDYFLANPKSMKVLSHEDDVLKNGFSERDASNRAAITAASNSWTRFRAIAPFRCASSCLFAALGTSQSAPVHRPSPRHRQCRQ